MDALHLSTTKNNSMIVSFTNRFIFIAVPRTGSTATFQALQSVGAAVVPYRGKGGCYGLDSNGFHDPYVPGELETYFTFAGCRNPYTRMVSHYLFAQTSERHRLHALATFTTFPEFADMAIATRQLTTQADFLGDTRVDAHVAMESGIAQQIQMLPCIQPTVLSVPICNNTVCEKPWYAHYNRSAIALVREWAAADFAKYGYSTDFADAVWNTPPSFAVQVPPEPLCESQS